MKISWSRFFQVLGGIGLLVGAVDPLEGSLIILPGSGLVALGAYLEGKDKRLVRFRIVLFLLIGLGVGALWGLSALGGIGGASGRSWWWGTLILPYLVGWTLSIWGPGSPSWQRVLGLCIGIFYLFLVWWICVGMLATREGLNREMKSQVIALVMGLLGVVTIVGCLTGLVWRQRPTQAIV